MADTDYPNPSNWCKFEAVDKTSFIIVCCVIATQCFSFCLFLRSLAIRVHNRIQISSDQNKLFKLMTVWFQIAFLKSLLNIVVYLLFQTDPTKQNLKSQMVLASICLFLDKMSSFCLHTILMSIPCIWIKNTVLRLEGEQLSLKQMKNVDLVFRILKGIQIYLKLRVLIIVVNLAFDIYMIINPNFGMYSKYLTSITMFEAVIAIFIYTFGCLNLYKFRHHLHFPKQLIHRIMLEYTLLMVCCIARLIFNFLYYFNFSIKSYVPGQNCLDLSKHISLTNYIYLSLGYATMHMLPIITIIMIYWPQFQNKKLKKGVLSFADIKFLKKRVLVSAHWKLLGSAIKCQSSEQQPQQLQQQQQIN